MAVDQSWSSGTECRDPGDTVAGRYRIVRRLAAGAHADVYEALGRDFGHVALKILHPAARETLQENRFIEETRLLSVLRHPNLLPLLDAGEHCGRAFIVLPLVDGGSLEDRLKSGPMRPGQVRRVGAAVAEALAYIHSRGVIHRDVKPGNILLGQAGEVWLGDFGVAKACDGPSLTAQDCVAGTAGYLSPEQAEGRGATTASDVYALGLVLLEALTGTREYTGTAFEKAVAAAVRSPRIPAALGAPWCAVLRRMTARDPAARPGIDETRALLQDRSTATVTAPAPPPLGVPRGITVPLAAHLGL